MTSSGQGPEIAARIRATGDDDVRAAFSRIRDDGRLTFAEINKGASDANKTSSASFLSSNSAIGTLSNTVSAAFGSIHRIVGGVGEAVGVVATTMLKVAAVGGIIGAAVGTGIGGAISTITGFASTNYEAIRSLEDLSGKTGLTVESISRLMAAVRLEDGDGQNAVKAIDHLSNAYYKVAEEGDKAAIPFLRLGVAVKDSNGTLRPFADVMNDVIGALNSVENPSNRARAAFELFGEGYKDVLDVITTSADGKTTFESRMADAGKYNTVFSQQYIDHLKEIQEDSSVVKENLRSIQMVLTEAFLPLTDNIFSKFISDNQASVKGWITTVGTAAIKMRDDVRRVFGIGDKGSDNEDTAKQILFNGKPVAKQNQIIFNGKPVGPNKPLFRLGPADGSAIVASPEEADESAPAKTQPKSQSQFNFGFFEKLAPIVKGIGSVVKDVSDAFAGLANLGDTVPWVGSLGAAFGGLASILSTALGAVVDFTLAVAARLPSVKPYFDVVAGALVSFEAGLSGAMTSVQKYPAFVLFGDIVRQAGVTIAQVVDYISSYLSGAQDAMGSFGSAALTVFGEIVVTVEQGISSVRKILGGKLLEAGELFSFLNPVVPYIKVMFDRYWTLVRDGIAAISSVLSGLTIAPGNLLEWLNPVVDYAKDQFVVVSKYARDGVAVLGNLFSNTSIDPGNLLSFLDPVLPYIRSIFFAVQNAFDDILESVASVILNVNIDPANMFSFLNPVVPFLHTTLEYVMSLFSRAGTEVVRFATSTDTSGVTLKGFVDGALTYLRDGFKALGETLSGGTIGADNVLAFLNPLVEHFRSAMGKVGKFVTDTFGPITWAGAESGMSKAADTIGGTFEGMVDQVIAGIDKLKSAGKGVLDVLDLVAKALGMTDKDGNGKGGQLGLEAAVVGLSLHFSGALPVIIEFLTVIVEVVVGLSALGSIIGLVGKLAWFLVFDVFVPLCIALGALFGVPAILVGTIILSLAALFIWWDKVKETFFATATWLADVGVAIRDTLMHPLDAIGRAIDALVDKFKSLKNLFTSHNAAEMSNEELGLSADGSKKTPAPTAPAPTFGANAAGAGFYAVWDGKSTGAPEPQPSLVDSLRAALTQAVGTQLPPIGQGATTPQDDGKSALAPVTLSFFGKDFPGFMAPKDVIDKVLSEFQDKLDSFSSMNRAQVGRGGQF